MPKDGTVYSERKCIQPNFAEDQVIIAQDKYLSYMLGKLKEQYDDVGIPGDA